MGIKKPKFKARGSQLRTVNADGFCDGCGAFFQYYSHSGNVYQKCLVCFVKNHYEGL